jgi:uncharacterized membrane protein YjjP (DUF1212 family)
MKPRDYSRLVGLLTGGVFVSVVAVYLPWQISVIAFLFACTIVLPTILLKPSHVAADKRIANLPDDKEREAQVV